MEAWNIRDGPMCAVHVARKFFLFKLHFCPNSMILGNYGAFNSEMIGNKKACANIVKISGIDFSSLRFYRIILEKLNYNIIIK
jgi:hypothetical protein